MGRSGSGSFNATWLFYRSWYLLPFSFLYRFQYLFQTGPSIPDDEEGHLAYKLGDVIDHEFMKCEHFSYICVHTSLTVTVPRPWMISDKILATLGEGTFGKVVKVKELNSWVTDFTQITSRVQLYREYSVQRWDLFFVRGWVKFVPALA